MHLTCMCITPTYLSLESKTLIWMEISNFVTKKINTSKVLDGDRAIANAPSKGRVPQQHQNQYLVILKGSTVKLIHACTHVFLFFCKAV